VPTLDIRIMAHPSRSDSAYALADRLAALNPVTVWDSSRGAAPSAMRTARLAWEMPTRGGATHRVVLQDDVVPADDFAGRLVHLLAQCPATPVGLHAAWGSRTGQAVRFAAYLGLGWAPVLGGALSGTGVALPVALAEEYADSLAGERTDERDSVSMYEFVSSREPEPVICVPNLIQHDVPYQPSIWPEKFVQGPRRSACYLPEYGLRGDGGGLGRIGVVPYLSTGNMRSRTSVHDQASGRFEDMPSWRYARRVGFGTNELLRHFSAPDIQPTRQVLSGYLDAAFQYEIWLTGFLSGLQLTALGGGSAPELTTPAAKAASRTFAAGCLSRVLSAAILDAVNAVVADLVEHALLAGLRTARDR
jgi:hypothetical protein